MISLNFNAYALLQKSGLFLASLGVLAIPLTAQAADSTTSILDWDEVGAPIEKDQVNTFNVGEGTVDIEFLNPENFAVFEGAVTPEINSILNGENPDSDQSLHLQIDDEATMRTSFNGFKKDLVNISFFLYDVDIRYSKTWQDVVTLIGYGADGSLVNPTFEILGTSYEIDGNTLMGSSEANNDSADGNVKVSFSGIKGFDLIFSDGVGTNPHGIGVGDIEVQDVPEPAAVLALGVFSLVAFSKRKFVVG